MTPSRSRALQFGPFLISIVKSRLLTLYSIKRTIEDLMMSIDLMLECCRVGAVQCDGMTPRVTDVRAPLSPLR